jgi:hypothetical protein
VLLWKTKYAVSTLLCLTCAVCYSFIRNSKVLFVIFICTLFVFCTVLKKKRFVHNKTHKSIIRSATVLCMQTLNTDCSNMGLHVHLQNREDYQTGDLLPLYPGFGKFQPDHGDYYPEALTVDLIHLRQMRLNCLETGKFP